MNDIVKRLGSMPDYCCSVPRLEARDEIERLREEAIAAREHLAALENVRTITIERCAQVAERWIEWDDRVPSPEAIARAIRALKDKP